MKTWIARIRSNYASESEWLAYCETYGLAARLGYSPRLAWSDNILIGGSANPGDFGPVILDEFTRGYIECALWSSRGGKFGECPCCGKMAVLDRLPEPEFEQQPMCAADGCGVREMSEEPPLDDNYSIYDFAPEALARAHNDCQRFQSENAEALALAKYPRNDSTDLAHAGHDFWLTRNGHGAGFWDGDLPDDIGDKLTEASKAFDHIDIYPGDDGKLYFS